MRRFWEIPFPVCVQEPRAEGGSASIPHGDVLGSVHVHSSSLATFDLESNRAQFRDGYFGSRRRGS